MIWVLDTLGVEAGPSAGMHVHINVLNEGYGDGEGREALSPRQIANVWAHYARFQVVIDEFLIDSRIQNQYAKPLLFQRQYLVDMPNPDRVRDDMYDEIV